MTWRAATTIGATIGGAIDVTARRLRSAGIEGSRREARLLLALAADIDPQTALGWPERSLTPEAGKRLEGLLRRRCDGEPLSRLRGTREFWSLPFRLTPDTLDPRPDTETVVEAVLASLDDRGAPLRLLDLGTGSGCILLALLRELPAASGVGIDASPGACLAARANARELGFADRCLFVACDWGDAIAAAFDVVVSNPPYIRDGEIGSLDPEVARFDPLRALSGGPDGLDAYRAIAPALPRLLTVGGLTVLEVGDGQAPAVSAITAAAGLSPSGVRRDLAGIERCVLAHRMENAG